MNLSDQSRIWIYLSSRNFTDAEVAELNQLIRQFCIQWTAHGANLRAHGEVRHHRFIVLALPAEHAAVCTPLRGAGTPLPHPPGVSVRAPVRLRGRSSEM